jgi:3-hydroxyisobutyrate dehydrogenase/2-hydroxy-3-oxopropionate reductase
MGKPMVRRLIGAGHHVRIFSRGAAGMQEMAAAGAAVATDLADLVRNAEAVCGCRVTPADSEALFMAPETIAAGRSRKILCIDFSTIDQSTATRIAGRLAQEGIDYLDAPVSGGPVAAEAGTLSVMVGGDAAAFERARPIFEAIGKSIVHMGPSGSGVATKLCNNIITGTMHVLIAEALVLGAKAGINPRRLYDVLRVSSARSNTLDRVVPNHFLPRDFEPRSALTTIIKDLDCANATAKMHGFALRLPEAARQCFLEAAADGFGDKDLSAVILSLEKAAGTTVGPA